MTINKYKSVIFACNDTILLAKQAVKDHKDMPIIVRHAQKMVINAHSARSAMIMKATEDYPYINWLNVALGTRPSEIDTSTGKVKELREAVIGRLMPRREGAGLPPNHGN